MLFKSAPVNAPPTQIDAGFHHAALCILPSDAFLSLVSLTLAKTLHILKQYYTRGNNILYFSLDRCDADGIFVFISAPPTK